MGPSVLDINPALTNPAGALLGQFMGLVPDDQPLGQAIGIVRDPAFQQTAGALWDLLSNQASMTYAGSAKVPVKARVGQFAQDWANQYDASQVSSMLEPAKQAWMGQRDALMSGLHRDWTPEATANMLSQDRPSFERLLSNLLMYDRTSALKIGEQWLRNQGIFSGGVQLRNRQAYGDVLNQLYGMATDLSRQSPWKSMGGAGENMKAMLFVLESGGLGKLTRTPGMFDRSGQITASGRQALANMMNSAGHGMRALQSMAGTSDATNTIKTIAASGAFGTNLFQQLTNPQIGNQLRAFNSLARTSGMTPEARLGLLKRVQDFTGSKDLRPALNYGMQLMGMSSIVEDPLNRMAGDPQKIYQLSVMAVDKARRDPRMKIASAAAAALEPVYGRLQAWNLVDHALAGTRNGRQMVGVLNQWLPDNAKLTNQSMRDLLAAPGAYDYFASGRAVNASMADVIRPMAAYMKSRSSFLRRYGDEIMRERGRLDMNTVSDWMRERGATPKQVGAVVNHLRQFGPHMAKRLGLPEELTSDDVFGFLSAGSYHGRRNQIVQAAEKQANLERDLAGVHAERGLPAAQKALAEGRGPMAAAGAALRGTPAPEETATSMPPSASRTKVGLFAGADPGKVQQTPRQPEAR